MAVINANYRRLYRLLFGLLILLCLLMANPVQASKVVEAQSVAQITYDDEGKPIDYPAAVFFDPVQEELYVISGLSGRIIVYGPDYFPRWSIGSGRGVIAPRGVTVLPDGRVFTVQVRNRLNPTPKLTVLNGAFYPEHEIFLNDIPAAENFVPRKVAFSIDGLMYVSGDSYRGVLVLDKEGYFLRMLQPTDKLSTLSRDYAPEESVAEKDRVTITEESGESDEFINIPEEFRPRSSRDARIGGRSEPTGVGPVKVNYVATDSNGRLYFISAETGRIYVHDSEERFLFAFGIKGGSPGQMSNPRALAIDEKRGLIYVADYMRHTILAYNLAGEYLFETGGRGESPGWFNYPNDITVNSRGEIIVADLFNNRVQVLKVDYESIFYDLKDILNSEPNGNDIEQGKKTSEGTTDENVINVIDLVPGMPDINYEDTGEKEILSNGGVKSNKQTDPDEPIEAEILPDQEIPVISE